MATLEASKRQQPCPHAHPSSHLVGIAPAGQVTLQGPVEWHRTRHVPWQVTSQLPVEEHVTTLPSPTVGAQSLTLVHV